MRKGQEFLVAHGLGEEVRVAGLQIEDDVEPGRPGRVDPRTDVVEGTLGRIVAVGARLRGCDSSDDLERRDHWLLADGVVTSGDLASTLERRIHRLLAEHTEVAVAGVPVDGDEAPTRKQHVATARQLDADTGTVVEVVAWACPHVVPATVPQRRAQSPGIDPLDDNGFRPSPKGDTPATIGGDVSRPCRPELPNDHGPQLPPLGSRRRRSRHRGCSNMRLHPRQLDARRSPYPERVVAVRGEHALEYR